MRRRPRGARPAAVHRPARAPRGSRRPADHQHQRRAAARLEQRAEARDRRRASRCGVCVVGARPSALIVARSSSAARRGPVFYKQERMGLDGKAFTVYKFRSMPVDAEDETGPVWARDDDPRATPIGRWLRRHDIDELPQFWNVLRGRHVDRRPAARAAVLRRAVQAPHPAVHAAPQGEGRHHRLGAGQRLARQHLAREADRVRPLLHRELVARARLQDHVAHRRPRASRSTPD